MDANRLISFKSWGCKTITGLALCLFSVVATGEEAGEDESRWLGGALDAVIAGKPLPKDTATVWGEIQRRLQWGQNDLRLLEAQGRLAFAQGRWLEALAALQKLSDPSPAVMEILAECLNSKGEKYEAASWMLKAARAHGPTSAKAIPLYRGYLLVRSDDIGVQAEFAGILTRQGKPEEAARIYRDRPEAFVDSVVVAMEAGKALEAQKWNVDALKLYVRALERNPKSEVLAKRAAAILITMTGTPDVAQQWQRLWELFPKDTVARNRALSVWESIRDVSHYRVLLDQALRRDSASPFLILHGMRDAKTRGDPRAAKRFAVRAAKSESCALDCANILAETLEGDSEITTHAALFLAEAKSPHSSPALLRAAARGLALQQKFTEACAHYEKAHAADAKILESRAEALEDLSHCEEPSAQALLAKLGGATSGNTAVLFSLARDARKAKKWEELSKLLTRLAAQPAVAFKEIWPLAEDLAQSSKTGGDSSIPILRNLALSKTADTAAVADLLGRLLFERKRCDEALPQLKVAQKAGRGGEDRLAECWNQKGNKKEAAYWTLRAARAQGADSEKAPPLYIAYLQYAPGDSKALSELAGVYRKQGKSADEAAVYRENPVVFIDSESVALWAGNVLESQKLTADAAGLYAKALDKHPKSEALAARLSVLLPGLEPVAAAARWQRLWELFPADTASRNRALSAFEAGGDSSRYLSLLEKSLRKDSLSPLLNHRAALAAMARGNKKEARRYAVHAVKAGGDSATLAILALTAAHDEDVKTHFELFLSEGRGGKPSPHVLRAAARGLSLQGKTDEACALYEKAHAASASVLQGRSEVLEDMSNCTAPSALAVLHKLGGAGSSNPQILVVLGREALREKKWDELKKLLESAVRQPKAPLREIWSLARELAYAKPELAGPVLKKMADAGDVEAATFYGRVLHDAKRYSEALPYLAAAQIAGRGVEEMVGRCQLETGDTAGAKQTFEKLYERTKDPVALRALAELGSRARDVDAELWALTMLEEGNAATPPERIRLGLLMNQKGDREQAGTLLDAALRDETGSGPEIARATLVAGLWAWEKRKTDRALKHLGNALKSLPDSAVGWKALGEAQASMGNWAEAGKAFTRGSELTPDDPAMAAGLLSAAKKSGDKKLLEKSYSLTLRLDSNDLEANKFFVDLHLGRKKCGEALPFLQRFTLIDPKDGKAWARYGNCLAEVSDFAAAGPALQTALDLGIEDDEVFVNRAMAYQSEGAKDMAESILSFVLSRSPKNEKARALRAKLKE